MAILIPRNRWTRKPPTGAQINWGHPLANGLAAYWMLNENGGLCTYDLVRQTRGDLNAIGVNWRPGPNGPVVSFDASDPDNISITTPDYLNFTDVVSVATRVFPISGANFGIFE